MKIYFQLLVIYALATFSGSVSCNKSKSNSDSSASRDAVITGYDQRLCPCCGGFMINFENNATPYAGRFYLVENDLTSFGLSPSSTFPVYVRVEYTTQKKCTDTSVTITSLVKKR